MPSAAGRTDRRQVYQDLADKFLLRETRIARAARGFSEDMLESLDAGTFEPLIEDIASRLPNIAARGFAATPGANQRVYFLRRTMREALTDGTASARALVADRLMQLARLEAKWTAKTLGDALGMRVPVPGVAQAIATPFLGKSLREWFDSFLLRPTLANATAAVQGGLVRSDAARSIVRAAALSFDKARAGAVTLVRTAAAAAAQAARQQVMVAAGVRQVVWVSTLDERTSAICIALDGSVFPIDQGQRPPAHPNCRSVIAPWFGGQAKPEGYAPWLRRQPRDVQDDVLGPKRAAAWRSGEIVLADLAKDNRVLTLEQLGID